jgi:hypothetical protein
VESKRFCRQEQQKQDDDQESPHKGLLEVVSGLQKKRPDIRPASSNPFNHFKGF